MQVSVIEKEFEKLFRICIANSWKDSTRVICLMYPKHELSLEKMVAEGENNKIHASKNICFQVSPRSKWIRI